MKKKRLYESTCVICGATIVSTRLHRKTCSVSCRKKHNRMLVKEAHERAKAKAYCAFCHDEFIRQVPGQIYCKKKCALAAGHIRQKAMYMVNGRKPRPLVTVAGGPATRTCLACGRPFDSSWIGNRICERCQRLAAEMASL